MWVEPPGGEKARVGRVKPGTDPEDSDAVLRDPPVPRLEDTGQLNVKLKALPLTEVRELASNEAMDLRSVNRPSGPLRRWDEGAIRLQALIESTRVEHSWANLRPELRLVVCAEYLRHHANSEYPKLNYLFLPTSDRDPGRFGSGPYHIDIYAMAEDGAEVFAQVPLENDNMKYNIRMARKVEALKRHTGQGNLVCFWDFGAALLGYTAHHDPEPFFDDGVQFITVEEVLRWAETQPAYADRLFSA